MDSPGVAGYVGAACDMINAGDPMESAAGRRCDTYSPGLAAQPAACVEPIYNVFSCVQSTRDVRYCAVVCRGYSVMRVVNNTLI